jgi:hypothetical protein
MLPDRKQVWIGATADVERALNEIHADLNEDQRFVMETPGNNMAFLHSAREVMITDDMAYFLNGARQSLYDLMADSDRSKPEIKLGEDE